MSRPPSPGAASGRSAGGGLSAVDLALLALAAGLIGLVLLLGDREADLRRSQVGFDGLAAWLAAEGHGARTYADWGTLDPGQVGLRVLPLFDADLFEQRPRPDSAEALVRQTSEIDGPSIFILTNKASLLPTLIVLPKWRSGLRLSGKAHPDLLIPADLGSDTLRGLGTILTGQRLDLGRLHQLHQGFADIPWRDGLAARLYAPQVIRGSDCRALVGSEGAMVLGECRGPDADRGFWLLSDPDLLNAHGLARGDNAAIAARLLPDLAGGRQIVVDYSQRLWARTRDEARPERTWSDLARFLAPPFEALWIGLGVLGGLLFWRASVRLGRPLARSDAAPGAARSVSIAAKARLIRRSGHDGALVAAHVGQRLQGLAVRLLGPAHAADREGAETRLLARLRARDPDGARALAAAAADARALPDDAAPQEAVRRLDRFERVIEETLDDARRQDA